MISNDIKWAKNKLGMKNHTLQHNMNIAALISLKPKVKERQTEKENRQNLETK